MSRAAACLLPSPVGALTSPGRADDNRRGGPAVFEARLERLADDELVRRCRERADGRAFGELYRRHYRRILAVALGLLRDAGLAEDLCHDAFVRAWEKLATLEGDFAPWVARIAQNLGLNRLRHGATRRRLGGELEPPAPPPRPEQVAAAREEGRLALSVLRSLRDEQRQVLVLRYLDGLSHAEIAERTGFAPGLVRSYLQNGRRSFRLAWNQRSGGGRAANAVGEP